MATQKIEYQNKVAIDDVGVPEKNKITAENMNEIKEVVNNNADNFDETTAAINERIDTANNAINNIVENTYTKTETDEKLAQKADISDIPTDLSQLSNATTKFVNETQLQEETTARENADNDLQGQIDAIVAASDVVDIVGTYQELENYDTSHLGDNDIIKVLKDSTHNNATSYYRWKKQSSTWQYIGSEGPYYTKSESDNKFVEKETGKGLSSNDFTNAYREKLDGIESGAEVNIIEKVKVNNTDLPIENKEVNIDLTDYVKNTDYATAQKGGVIKTGGGSGTDILNGILRANEYDYNAYSYVDRKAFIGKGTLENVITGKGLIDSSSNITGNASTSTTLKSFNYNRNGTNYIWAKVATASLVKTWEEKHAYLFVKGTHSTNFKQNGIISIDAVGNAIKSKVNAYSAQFISASADLNLENFYIEYQDGDENTNATINFWVKNTTSAYASWQFKILQNTGWTIESAYTSVTTLPTQNFTGKISELNNKTLNDKDGNDISTTYVKNTDYASQGKAGVIKTNSNYAIETNSSNGNVQSQIKDYNTYTSGSSSMFISKGTLENVIAGKGLVNQETLEESQASQDEIIAKLKADHPDIEEEGTDLSINGTGDFDLALSPIGNITQDGEPSPSNEVPVKVIDGEYEVTVSNSDNTQSQTETIDTSPNPLYSANDYYYKSNGEWYVHNEWGKVVLTGASSESWNNVYTAFGIQISKSILSGGAYSNYYKYDNRNGGMATLTNGYFAIQTISENNYSTIYIQNTNIASVEDFKTWLSNHNTTVFYPLATPTNTQITNTTLINQLEALQNMLAYQDQTNISQTHNEAQADMIINAKTIMSMRYLQSEIEELKQAILNS